MLTMLPLITYLLIDFQLSNQVVHFTLLLLYGPLLSRTHDSSVKRSSYHVSGVRCHWFAEWPSVVIAIKYNLFHFKFGGHFEYLIISNLEFRKTFSNLRLLNEHSNK